MGVTGGQWIRFSGYAWATVQACTKEDIFLSESARVCHGRRCLTSAIRTVLSKGQ